METDQAIREEIRQLAEWYGQDISAFMPALSGHQLDHYVELVLGERNLEVVLGGMKQEQALANLARANGFPAELLQAFEACVRRFPDKMLYTKCCPGNPDTTGSMYLVLVEPWEAVLEFLGALSFASRQLAELEHAVRGSGICFILGFTYDLETNSLVVKTYYLFDRSQSNAPIKPFLVSERLTRHGLHPNPKYYTAKVSWNAFSGSPRMQKVAEIGAALFGDRYALLEGTSNSGERKAYVFRYDRRENDRYSLKTYNYYLEQGNKFLSLQRNEEALHAFQNAVDFDPQDTEALNRLGFAVMLSGNYIEGIEMVLQAKARNPHVSNIIWSWSNPIANQDAEILRLTQALEENPQAHLYHQRGILHFQQRDYEQAEADLHKTLELSPMDADAYNNLGGIYLKTGRWVEAVKACNIALSINPQISTSNIGIAKEAIRLNREAENNPSEKAFVDLGKYLYQMDRFEEAQASFYKAAAFKAVLQTH